MVALAVIHVDLTGEPMQAARVLGATTDAILAAPRATLVFDLGANAVHPHVLGKMLGWARRNEVLLRTRTPNQVLVVPRLSHRIQWRLAMMMERPIVSSAIVRSRAAADAWLARHR